MNPKNLNLNGIPDGWLLFTLGQLVNITAGGTPSTSVEEYWNGDIPWMNSGEINLRRIKEVEGRITEKGLKNSSTKLIPVNCVLIALAGQGSTRGKVALNEIELCTNQSLAAMIPKQGIINEFLFQNLDARYQEIRGMSMGEGGRGGLNLAILRAIPILTPPLEEQQKIANILSTVDAKIEVIEAQINETQQLKKGLMQRLLTKGIGHTKFKDSPLGKIPEGWEVGTFNKIAEHITKKYMAKEGRCVDLEHINQNTGILLGYGNILEKSSIKNHFTTGDVLFGKLRPYLRKYWLAEFEGGCTTELMVFRSKGNSDPKFVFYITQLDSFIENSVSKSFGTKMPRTSWRIVSEFLLGIPSKEEQFKIGEVLSSVDEKLAALQNKIEYYQDLKKGLIQKLLTGKIRVKLSESAIDIQSAI